MTFISHYRMALDYYDASYPADLFEPPETPVVSALNPTSITLGTPTEVTLTGTGFGRTSVVWADEEPQQTQHLENGNLVYQAEADSVGSQTITVRNGSLVSNEIELTTTAPNPLPVLTSINPQGAEVGDSTVTVTLTGTGFIPTSVIQAGAANRPTTYVNDTTLTGTILGSAMTGPTSIGVSVSNPPPGGGASGQQVFTVQAPS
jgi:trimeric autotransporter adhesin